MMSASGVPKKLEFSFYLIVRCFPDYKVISWYSYFDSLAGVNMLQGAGSVHFSYFLLFFFFVCLMISASGVPKNLEFSFSLIVRCFPDFDNSISPVVFLLPFFMINMTHFSIPNSISISGLYILIVCDSDSSLFSFFTNILKSFIYMRWFTFSCDFVNLRHFVHFLNI